ILTARNRKLGLLQIANPFTAGMVYCLRIDYYLYADESSSFDVIVEGGKGSRILYRAYEANMIKWRVARIEVQLHDQYDWLRINGSVLSGALALDRIRSWKGPCDGENQHLVHGRHFCDFELNSTCMFKPGGLFAQQWRVIGGADLRSHPLVDHTTHIRTRHFYGRTYQLAR